MIIATAKITLRAPWVKSLKEKRMVLSSLKERIKNKFNVSVAEIESQDNHKIIVLGIAAVCNETSKGDAMINSVINFIEENSEAFITDIETEII
ncbi:DUF503 domain-containing protein [Clostridium hydrogeniformans]|uniref:DUF503 domain-containing protein n=1 Tax=Clostridium hydrogeniformans TaxID=349933 RepID=UPI0004846859|nr:DUF503 domain-containing protein [Clostridium hydrogeniformans]